MRGGFARAYTPADHPIVAFRKSVIACAKAAATGQQWSEATSSRVRIRICCNFVRPKSHYRAKKQLKTDAPDQPRPDVDNLAKGVMDAITMAGLWSDDVVVSKLVSSKRYVSDKLQPHVVVEVL